MHHSTWKCEDRPDMYSALIGTIFLNLHFFFMCCIHFCFLLVCTHRLKSNTKGKQAKRQLNSTQLDSTPTAHCTKIKKYCYPIRNGIVIEWFPNIYIDRLRLASTSTISPMCRSIFTTLWKSKTLFNYFIGFWFLRFWEIDRRSKYFMQLFFVDCGWRTFHCCQPFTDRKHSSKALLETSNDWVY